MYVGIILHHEASFPGCLTCKYCVPGYERYHIKAMLQWQMCGCFFKNLSSMNQLWNDRLSTSFVIFFFTILLPWPHYVRTSAPHHKIYCFDKINLWPTNSHGNCYFSLVFIWYGRGLMPPQCQKHIQGQEFHITCLFQLATLLIKN